jgi:DNA-binding response OmpR family regulator
MGLPYCKRPGEKRVCVVPPGDRRKILIVEDDLDLAEMLDAYFHVQGYKVKTVAWGREAVDLASQTLPDLVVLDIRLPDIDGFEVCTRLRESHKTRNIPIIFLTERNERVDRLHGLGMGVVDYITKPFDIQELRLRVRNTLRRAETMLLENPVTGLPEGAATDEVLQAFADGKYPDKGLLVAALRGLDAYRELYGFVASDDVLRVTSLTLENAASEMGGDDAFCAHLDGQTFVVLVPADRLDALRARIMERIGGGALEYFYPADNRGPNAHTGDRLRLDMGRLTTGDGPFRDVESLRQKALQVRREDPQKRP